MAQPKQNQLINLPLFNDLPLQKVPVPFSTSKVDPIWTENKAQLIALYLKYFTFITKHGAYIDGFAGPKNVKLPNSWAAELVLANEPKWINQFMLCDMDKDKIAALTELKSRQEFQKKRSIDIYSGDFNKQIDNILSSGLIKDKTATFCLLDQFSCNCHWTTVQKLATHKSVGSNKIELLYFLATGWLGRTLAGFKDDNADPDLWWGSSSWRDLKGSNGNAIAVEMSERFRDELGYTYVNPWPIYKREHGQDRIMFHLIHASDHPEAKKLMRRAYKKVLDIPDLGYQPKLL